MNKVKYGLKNTHYAVVAETNGVVTYGTPKPIPGAVNLVQNPAGETVTFYADDTAYFEENTNNGYEGTLEIALVSDQFRVEVFGDEIDLNGALIENANAKPKKIALMYEFDGDTNKTRHVSYNVSVSRPNLEGSTKTNTKEPKTETMNIAARPALDTSDVKAKLKQGSTGYNTFFTAVYLKNAAINTVAVSMVTFSKALNADVNINVTSNDANNSVLNVRLDGSLIPGIHLTVTGVDVIIDESYFDTLNNGSYTVAVEFARGNAINVALTVTA